MKTILLIPVMAVLAVVYYSAFYRVIVKAKHKRTKKFFKSSKINLAINVVLAGLNLVLFIMVLGRINGTQNNLNITMKPLVIALTASMLLQIAASVAASVLRSKVRTEFKNLDLESAVTSSWTVCTVCTSISAVEILTSVLLRFF